MQRLLSYFLLTLFVTTSLYALRGPVDGRYYNRDYQRRELAQNNSGSMDARDSDGSPGGLSLNTDASCNVNIFWDNEEQDTVVSYFADATINGSGPDSSYGGYYMVNAWVIYAEPDLKHNTWVGYADDEAAASTDMAWEGPANNVGEALRALLWANTEAQGSIDGGSGGADDNSNSGSCGSGSCGPGDEWGYSMAMVPF